MLDAVTGVIEKSTMLFEPDGSEDWAYAGNYASTGGGYYYTQLVDNVEDSAVLDDTNSVSDRFQAVTLKVAVDSSGVIGYGNGMYNFRIRPYEESVQNESSLAAFKQWLANNRPKFVLPLLSHETIQLTPPDFPVLPAPNVNVWAAAEVPAEVELDVVKVDYLSNGNDGSGGGSIDPDDFEPAFDILPVSKGGTGVSSAQAERNRLGLGNTTGAVPVANGGTGATSAAAAREALGAGTSNFSGSYNDLEDKPAIPSVSYPISIANGGTGATTAEAARQALGAGTSDFSGSYNDLADKPDIPSIELPLSAANGGTGVTSAQAERNRLGLGNTTGAVPIANGGTGATTAANARNNLLVMSGVTSIPDGEAYSAFSVTVTADIDCRNKPIFVDDCFDMDDPGAALAMLEVTQRTSTGFKVEGMRGNGSGESFCWLVLG